MAAIFRSGLLISPRPKISFSSFESLILSFSHPKWKSQKPLVFVVVYRPPGPYSEFLSEFSEFLSQLVLSTDKVIVVGDFNIHIDVENDSLNVNFNSILDSIGFSQSVHRPTHCLNHTLDLVLTYGIESEQLTVFPHFFSNIFLLDFFRTHYKKENKKIEHTYNIKQQQAVVQNKRQSAFHCDVL